MWFEVHDARASDEWYIIYIPICTTLEIFVALNVLAQS
jgi:hypothetical protein